MNSILLVIVCTLVTVTQATSLGNSIEIHELDSTYKTIVKYANVILAYKQYVPADLVMELEGMVKPENYAEIHELVECITHEEMTTKFDAAMFVLIKEQCPGVYTRISRLFTSSVLRYMSLSDSAQSFITESVGNRESQTLADHVRYVVQLKKQFDKLPWSAQVEYEVQFPELMKFFRTPAYQTFINTLIELSDKSDEEVIEGFSKAVKQIATDFSSMKNWLHQLL